MWLGCSFYQERLGDMREFQMTFFISFEVAVLNDNIELKVVLCLVVCQHKLHYC